ncbi:MAG: PQQ-binding-like beta-propeller repeat protein [Acidimicrobiales bacterium]
MGRRGARTALVAAALVAVCLAGCASGASITAAPPPSNDAFTAAPPEVVSAGSSQWPLPGHDYDNTRDAGRSPIDAQSVARLAPSWTVAMTGELTTVPIILGARIYVEDDNGSVVSIDRSTGRVLWRSKPLGFSIGPDGVAVGWGKVFAATGNGVVALSATTGSSVWSRRLTTTPSEGVDDQPTVADGRVFVATVPVSAGGIYKGGDRGWLFALDASTGRTDWSFDTVKSPDIWGNPAVNSGGGAWYPPSIDVAANRVYWGTANPAPFPGTTQYPNGSSRPGSNLYTDSTLALDLRSGRLVWYHQATAHDIFDRDFVHTMIVNIPGASPRQVIVGTGKSGFVLGYDPTSGRLLWRTPVGMHHNGELTALSGPTVVLPGTYGGVLTPPASANGVVYAATLNAPDTLYPDRTAYFGGKLGTFPGDVVAINALTGKVVWDTTVPGDPTGGATVVNNLVLTATYQGTLVAIDRSTGRIVMERVLPGAVNGWMAISDNLVVVPITGSHPSEVLALRLPGDPPSH